MVGSPPYLASWTRPVRDERYGTREAVELPAVCLSQLNRVKEAPYLASWTRPDGSRLAVSELSRVVSSPGKPHLEAAKCPARVNRYPKQTMMVFRVMTAPLRRPSSFVISRSPWLLGLSAARRPPNRRPLAPDTLRGHVGLGLGWLP